MAVAFSDIKILSNPGPQEFVFDEAHTVKMTGKGIL